ncbi:unnamed protein product [Onchocerca ochengi]|uniref:Ovule protein n=1 Tax=Onchocerca ochengi TaxID=42157 RepID=A0A182EUY7_ONCOC|nr:unnamed protein product [Onchocerca ochengi]
MTGKNWLSSSSFEKGEIIDEGNEIDINVMEQESFPMEISADSSLKSFPSSSIQSDFRIKSTKLGMSSIAIAEKDDPKKFRIYRPLNCGPSESMIYYRCSKCELLEKKAFGSLI